MKLPSPARLAARPIAAAAMKTGASTARRTTAARPTRSVKSARVWTAIRRTAPRLPLRPNPARLAARLTAAAVMKTGASTARRTTAARPMWSVMSAKQ